MGHSGSCRRRHCLTPAKGALESAHGSLTVAAWDAGATHSVCGLLVPIVATADAPTPQFTALSDSSCCMVVGTWWLEPDGHKIRPDRSWTEATNNKHHTASNAKLVRDNVWEGGEEPSSLDNANFHLACCINTLIFSSDIWLWEKWRKRLLLSNKTSPMLARTCTGDQGQGCLPGTIPPCQFECCQATH